MGRFPNAVYSLLDHREVFGGFFSHRWDVFTVTVQQNDKLETDTTTDGRNGS